MRKYQVVGLLAMLFSACTVPGSPPSGKTPQPMGLLKVTITGIGEPVAPTATAQWVQTGPGSQAVTVVPVGGTNALDDVQFTRSAVSFYDDLINGKRYVVATFLLTNRMNIGFNNLTLYAVNAPGVTKGGTGIISMRDATNTLLTDETKYRALKPSHGMMAGVGNLVVNPNIADLQWMTPSEVGSVKGQAIAQGLLTASDTVLEYGFVARSLSNVRPIAARDTANDCTNNTCKGTITLAYSLPLGPPDPTRFSLYFLAGDESDAHLSQSIEEQMPGTVAGLSSGVGSFNQVKTLLGSIFSGANKNDLCSVRTAVPTASSPGNVYLPATLPSAPGSLDLCFDTDGKVMTDFASSYDVASSIAIQSDGKIVVAGVTDTDPGEESNYDFALARYNSGGSLDTAFGIDAKVITAIGSNNDVARSLAIQPDGKILVGGYSLGNNNDFALARYNPDGSLDITFDGDGKASADFDSREDRAHALVIQADGKIVMAGFSGIDDRDFALVRYNSNGSLDVTFDTDGRVTTDLGSEVDVVNSLAIQPDGKILVGGYSLGNNNDFALARYNPDGSLDISFGTGGKVTTAVGSSQDIAYSLALQSDGKILAAGSSFDTVPDFAVVRYNPDGSLDTSFGISGKVITAFSSNADEARSIAIQSDGKIVVGGFSLVGNTFDFALARYNPNGSLDSTFDTDGKVTNDLGSRLDQIYSVAIQSDGKVVAGGFSNKATNYDFALARYNP